MKMSDENSVDGFDGKEGVGQNSMLCGLATIHQPRGALELDSKRLGVARACRTLGRRAQEADGQPVVRLDQRVAVCQRQLAVAVAQIDGRHGQRRRCLDLPLRPRVPPDHLLKVGHHAADLLLLVLRRRRHPRPCQRLLQRFRHFKFRFWHILR